MSCVLTTACLVPQVPEAEKARLREKMLKRRHEQDAKALQEKLAASEAQQREAQREEAGVTLHRPPQWCPVKLQRDGRTMW